MCPSPVWAASCSQTAFPLLGGSPHHNGTGNKILVRKIARVAAAAAPPWLWACLPGGAGSAHGHWHYRCSAAGVPRREWPAPGRNSPTRPSFFDGWSLPRRGPVQPEQVAKQKGAASRQKRCTDAKRCGNYATCESTKSASIRRCAAHLKVRETPWLIATTFGPSLRASV